MSGHVVSVKTYVLIFLALLALTGLTTGMAFVDLGALNTVFALAIAGCKMMLVILFFMHLRSSNGLTKMVLAAGFFWLMILISLTMSDFATRDWTPAPDGWSSAQASGAPASPSATDAAKIPPSSAAETH
jgi:cytochrome c oxidase subunit 4